jgi:DNA excision repair protein ERCC-4
VDLVTGIYVLHADRVKEFSSEAFVLRLFRQKNNRGWIKAISDEPTGFTGGIFKLEKSLKVLYQRHVSLWPRFQIQVKHDIEGREQVEMVELRIPLTKGMKKIQLALWECLELVSIELFIAE